jgi:hypothetical protein
MEETITGSFTKSVVSTGRLRMSSSAARVGRGESAAAALLAANPAAIAAAPPKNLRRDVRIVHLAE